MTIDDLKAAARVGIITLPGQQPVRGTQTDIQGALVTVQYIPSASGKPEFEQFMWIVHAAGGSAAMRDEAFVAMLLDRQRTERIRIATALGRNTDGL